MSSSLRFTYSPSIVTVPKSVPKDTSSNTVSNTVCSLTRADVLDLAVHALAIFGHRDDARLVKADVGAVDRQKFGVLLRQASAAAG